MRSTGDAALEGRACGAFGITLSTAGALLVREVSAGAGTHAATLQQIGLACAVLDARSAKRSGETGSAR